MDIFVLLKMAFIWGCWLAMGILVGQLYVHYVESELKKIQYSYFKYAATIFLIFFFIWVLVKIGGFEKKEHWTLSLLPIVVMVVGIVLTVKILFKKKGINFLNKEGKGL